MVRPRGMYYLGPDTFQAKKKKYKNIFKTTPPIKLVFNFSCDCNITLSLSGSVKTNQYIVQWHITQRIMTV